MQLFEIQLNGGSDEDERNELTQTLYLEIPVTRLYKFEADPVFISNSFSLHETQKHFSYIKTNMSCHQVYKLRNFPSKTSKKKKKKE